MSFTESNLKELLKQINPTNKDALNNAKTRLDSLVKPPESLGQLEEIAKKLSAINEKTNYSIDKRCILIFASDNGVVEEGIASADQSVTLMQTLNFTYGITGVAVLAKKFNTDLIITDVGINADLDNPKIINKKIRKSTGNIAKEEAMTKDEALQCIKIGIDSVEEAKKAGYNLIGAGEMGIGNTTTSSAVLSSLLNLTDDEISLTVGRGAGLSDKAYQTKKDIIKKILKLHNPDSNNVIDILHKVGGFDIASICGVFIGAALYKIPVVIDGFISSVAALSAIRLNPTIKDYIFASHYSNEKGFSLVSEAIGLEAPLHLNMRLGEGSGCPIMFSIMDAATTIINDMGTFEEAKIDENYSKGINFN